MAIVVDEDQATTRGILDLAHHEAPADALETRQGAADGRHRHPQFQTHGDRRQGIEDIVAAREVEFHRETAARMLDLEEHPQPFLADLIGPHVRLRPGAIGPHGARDLGYQVPHLLVVDTEHRQPVEGQMVQKLHEGIAQPAKVVAIGHHVVGVDVGDDRQHGLQIEEGGVALVGLRHQVVMATQPGVGAGAVQEAADDKGGVQAALRQDARHQAGGGGLAVGPGDRHAMVEAHELRQHLGAPHQGGAGGAGGDDLGVGLVDGAGDDNGIHPLNLVRRVADEDPGAQLLQPLGGRVGPLVGTGYLVAQVQHDLGDTAHARAADTDEVQATDTAHAAGMMPR